MSIRVLLVTLVAVVALAGCGRRGDLEGPGATTPAPADAAATTVQPGSGLSPLDPGSPGKTDNVTPPANAPKKRFPLDFLL